MSASATATTLKRRLPSKSSATAARCRQFARVEARMPPQSQAAIATQDCPSWRCALGAPCRRPHGPLVSDLSAARWRADLKPAGSGTSALTAIAIMPPTAGIEARQRISDQPALLPDLAQLRAFHFTLWPRSRDLVPKIRSGGQCEGAALFPMALTKKSTKARRRAARCSWPT